MAILEVTKAEANQSRFGFKGHTKRFPPLMFLYIFDLQQSERERTLVFLSCLFDTSSVPNFRLVWLFKIYSICYAPRYTMSRYIGKAMYLEKPK